MNTQEQNGPHINKPSEIIEIYKIVVEAAERNIERRMRTNQFYFSIIAGLFVAYSYLADGKLAGLLASVNVPQSSVPVPIWALPMFLLIMSMSWFSMLLSFRALSVAKYKVISDIEKQLPFGAFDLEWQYYKAQRKIETTQLELAIPLLFYAVAAIGLVFPFL